MDAEDIFDITGWDTVNIIGTVYTFTYTGSDTQQHTFVIDAQSENGEDGVDIVQIMHGPSIVCFARDTLIDTINGSVPIQILREGDLVKCGDGQLRPICWVGSKKLSEEDLAQKPEWHPIRLRKNALGDGQPNRDLVLSPNHNVLLRDWRAELLFGDNEVLVPAKHLTNDFSIHPDYDRTEVEYFHILLEGHHTIFADGLECESLFIGALRTGALSPEARDEICGLFPELVGDLGGYGEVYRQPLRKFEAEALLNACLFS